MLLGQLCIETDPAGAQVYIDRQLVGVTPYANDIPFGRYLVELRLSNYETVRQIVNIDANLPRYPLATTLRKLTGFWIVRSQPSGAEVSVDGISVGKTPLT
ncbi:MAG: PEGA domain-containing protein, partial [Kiritimatiellia bacterium]